jgi:pimeloyl-ACP methyl ester carboxylesterase
MKKKCNVSNFLLGSFIFVMFGLFSSCQKDQVSEKQQPSTFKDLVLSGENQEGSLLKCGQSSTLISYKLVNSLSAESIKTLVGPSFSALIKNGVKMYKVSYRTLYKRKTITVSGVVGVPDIPVDCNTAVVMYDHGTRITEADLLPSSGFDLISVVSAANGKICFAADYIGFGDSKQVFHPYLVISESVYPVCDMIVAGKEFLQQEFNIKSKPSLIIFGFSQGGSVTMAVQRELERNPYYRHQIHLKGVAMATGPYDLHNSAIFPLVGGETYSQPCLFLFAFISYNNYYRLGYDLNKIFKNSYGQVFLDMVAQNKTSAQINAVFPLSLEELFQDDFRADFLAERTPFNFLFKLNATYKGWVPKSPTRIYHSPADEIVPYANAEVAYNTFITGGAKSVELITLPPVGHVNSSFIAFANIISWIDSN